MTTAAPPTHTSVDGAVLFTDLVGFTEFNEVRGDDAAVELLDRQRRIVDAVVDELDDARVVKELGDGLMVWFADAAEAVTAAMTSLDRIAAERADAGFALPVRMGMHHGESTVRGDDLVGRTVNVAARVADLAGPGELLVSDEVIRACDTTTPGGCGLKPLGPVTVKGVANPIWLHRVIYPVRG